MPAVMALRSAGAATGSLGACLAKANIQASTQGVTNVDDAIFRYQLYAFVASSGNIREQSGYWINGSELDVYIRLNQPTFLGDNWQQFDITNNVLVGSPQSTAPTAPPGFTRQKVQKWVSLRVDANGKLTGAGASGAGSAVGDSCWNSFAAAAPP